jgi:hypothetical protein
MLEAGLLRAGQYLKSGEDSEMVIDSRGMFVNTTTGDYAGKDSIFIGGGRMLFTDDNWRKNESVKKNSLPYDDRDDDVWLAGLCGSAMSGTCRDI